MELDLFTIKTKPSKSKIMNGLVGEKIVRFYLVRIRQILYRVVDGQ
jgi:hypothetical protein